jgi:hypothetical protein
LHLFVTSYNNNIIRDTYFEVVYEDTTTAYVVSELDVNSTPGTMYVTVDPSYIRDKSADEKEEFESAANHWLNGGNQ